MKLKKKFINMDSKLFDHKNNLCMRRTCLHFFDSNQKTIFSSIAILRQKHRTQLFLQSIHFRSSPREVRCKEGVLKISQNLQENICTRVSFLIKLQAHSCNFIKKETLAQVLSWEFSKIFKNTFVS